MIKENNHLGLVSIFILFSSLLLTTTTFPPSASAFINQNLLGLSPNMPGTIAPISLQIGSPYPGYGGGFGGYGGQSFGTGLTGLLPQVLGLGTGYSIGPGYGGGFGGYGGGYGGQSFGTGLTGLLPQVLGGIGSLFGQDYGSGYGMGGGYGYDPGYVYGNDQGFSEFETNNDPFDLGYGGNEAQDYGLDISESYSNTPVEDLRALDSPSEDPFFFGGGDDFSQSPVEDLRALDSPSDDPFFSGGGDDFSESPFGGFFGG